MQSHDAIDEPFRVFLDIAAPHGAVRQIIDDFMVGIAQAAGIALQAAVDEVLDSAEADLAVGGQRRTGSVRSELVEIATAEAGQDLHAVTEQSLFMGPCGAVPTAFPA